MTDDYIEDLTGTEIEDLLPAPLLVQVLDRMERRAQQDFEDFHDPQKPIVPQIKSDDDTIEQWTTLFKKFG